MPQLEEDSTPDRRSPGETLSCTLMALGDVKYVVGAMPSKFPFKLYLWGYQSGGAIPSVIDQNSDGMSPDHP